MGRVQSVTVRVLIGSIAGLLLLATPARASILTINFEGQIDLSAEGGALYQYNGFFSWDTAALPHESEPLGDSYAVFNYALTFDGTDVTIAPSPDGNGNGLFVANDYDVFGTGPIDGFGFYGVVGRPVDPGSDQALFMFFTGPTTMFPSTALPTNLNFLTDPGAEKFSMMFFEPDDPEAGEGFFPPQGTINVINAAPTPVPEPATLALTAFGLAGVAARARRKRAK